MPMSSTGRFGSLPGRPVVFGWTRVMLLTFRSTALALALAVAVPSVRAAEQGSAPAKASAQDYVFPSGAGALFFHVKPDRTLDFESVVATLADVLGRTTDPIRRQQAESWRIFKSTETPKDFAIYVFLFDPAVLGADYDPIKVLGEAIPAELQGLYERLRADVARVERMGLAKIR